MPVPALSTPLPTTQNLAAASSVTWQPVAALPFYGVLRSDAPQVLEQAAMLFAPWCAPATPAVQSPQHAVRRMECHVEAETELVGAGEVVRWRVTNRSEPQWRQLTLSELLTRIEYDAIWHLVTELETDFVGFHGALLSKAGRGVLIIGSKEAGKSTLACALWRSGWRLLCDDYTLIGPDGLAHATARRVSLRESSRALLEADLWEQLASLPSSLATPAGLLFHPHQLEAAPNPGNGPVTLGAIILLGRPDSPALPARTSPIPAVRAALSLLSFSTLFLEANPAPEPASGAAATPSYPPHWFSLLPRMKPLVEAVPAFDLGRGALHHMVESVENVVFA